jgi:peroxiredoxin
MQTIFDKKKTPAGMWLIAVVTVLIGGFIAFFTMENETNADDSPFGETAEPQAHAETVVQQIGQTAPEFSAKDVKLDKEISLARFAKMDVLLYFWDPYDDKQSARIERLIELQKTYKGKIAVIGIARNTGKLKMESLIKENKINFPVILSTDEIEKAYSASPGNSYCVLIGLDRTILDSYTGVLNINKLSSKIEGDVK